MRSWTRQTFLNVSGQQFDISTIVTLPRLHTLVASECHLSGVGAVCECRELFNVILSRNRGLLDLRPLGSFSSLGVVDLGGCSLSVQQLLPLRETLIMNLALHDNPGVTGLPLYRPFLVTMLPFLWCLDGLYVTEREREDAAALFFRQNTLETLTPIQRRILKIQRPAHPRANATAFKTAGTFLFNRAHFELLHSKRRHTLSLEYVSETYSRLFREYLEATPKEGLSLSIFESLLSTGALSDLVSASLADYGRALRMSSTEDTPPMPALDIHAMLMRYAALSQKLSGPLRRTLFYLSSVFPTFEPLLADIRRSYTSIAAPSGATSREESAGQLSGPPRGAASSEVETPSTQLSTSTTHATGSRYSFLSDALSYTIAHTSFDISSLYNEVFRQLFADSAPTRMLAALFSRTIIGLSYGYTAWPDHSYTYPRTVASIPGPHGPCDVSLDDLKPAADALLEWYSSNGDIHRVDKFYTCLLATTKLCNSIAREYKASFGIEKRHESLGHKSLAAPSTKVLPGVSAKDGCCSDIPKESADGTLPDVSHASSGPADPLSGKGQRDRYFNVDISTLDRSALRDAIKDISASAKHGFRSPAPSRPPVQRVATLKAPGNALPVLRLSYKIEARGSSTAAEQHSDTPSELYANVDFLPGRYYRSRTFAAADLPRELRPGPLEQLLRGQTDADIGDLDASGCSTGRLPLSQYDLAVTDAKALRRSAVRPIPSTNRLADSVADYALDQAGLHDNHGDWLRLFRMPKERRILYPRRNIADRPGEAEALALLPMGVDASGLSQGEAPSPSPPMAPPVEMRPGRPMTSDTSSPDHCCPSRTKAPAADEAGCPAPPPCAPSPLVDPNKYASLLRLCAYVRRLHRQQIRVRAVTQLHYKRLHSKALCMYMEANPFFTMDMLRNRDHYSAIDRERLANLGVSRVFAGSRRFMPLRTDDVIEDGLIRHIPRVFPTRRSQVEALSVDTFVAGLRKRRRAEATALPAANYLGPQAFLTEVRQPDAGAGSDPPSDASTAEQVEDAATASAPLDPESRSDGNEELHLQPAHTHAPAPNAQGFLQTRRSIIGYIDGRLHADTLE